MFTTERLVFRALDQEQDLQLVNFWINDPEGQFYMTTGPLMPGDSTGSNLMGLFDAEKREGLPCFAICLKPEVPLTSENYFKELKMVGMLNIRPYGSENIRTVFKNRHVSFGISLDTPLRGQGYGQEALGFLKKYVFEDLGMHRLSLYVSSTNERAQKAYHKAGFTLEGRRRQTHLAPDGSWYDTLDMSILEHEYRAQKIVK